MFDVSQYNIAEKSKYFAVFPVELIQEEYKYNEIPMNFQAMHIPKRSIESSDVGFRGQTYYYPNGTQTFEKTVDFRCIMSSNLIQYWFLDKWLNKIVTRDSQKGGNPEESMISISIYKLSEFNNIVAEFIFHHAWLSELGNLGAEISGEDETVDFTLTFSDFEINYNKLGE